MSPDFIVNITFTVYAVGIFFAMITVLATNFCDVLSPHDNTIKIVMICALSWVIVIAILAPKIIRLYKHKW